MCGEPFDHAFRGRLFYPAGSLEYESYWVLRATIDEGRMNLIALQSLLEGIKTDAAKAIGECTSN